MAFETGSPIPPLHEVGTPIIAPIVEGPPDLIPGFLPKKGQLVVAGETDIGKSLVALEVCSSLITGNPLWGELKPTEVTKRILYVLGEHYNEVIQRLWQVTRLPMTDQVFLLGPEQLGYDKWLVAQGRVNMNAVAKLTRWAEGVDLVVFDPLASFVTGVDIENDNNQMRLVLDTMSLITQTVGASCMVLAHQGKPMMDKFGAEHTRKTYAIRGASGIEDAATNIFYMSLGKDSTADTKILSMTRRKYKGTAPEEYKLVRNPKTLVHSILGGTYAKTEVRKIEMQAAYHRFHNAFPDMKKSDIVKALVALDGHIGERTVWDYIS